MKNLFCTLATIILIVAKTSAGSDARIIPATNSVQSHTPAIIFTENKGQLHDQNSKPRADVLYGVMAGNMAVHIKKTGVSYQLYRVDSWKETEDLKTREKRKEIDQQTICRIDLTWLNANPNFTRTEDEALPGYSNYYVESCPNGALGVKSYKGITLRSLYKGIDLHYYEKNGELKHDYIVSPHSDYQQIKILVEGAEASITEDGSLILNTPLGKVQEGAPVVYQNKKLLKARWVIVRTSDGGGQSLSFEIENYNPTYELIIDPVTRLWGTFYGGTSNDVAYSCASDGLNNVYLTGGTSSNTGTNIATSGSHQFTVTNIGGYAYLAKFNSAGTRLWATYYGAGYETGNSCAADASGNVVMAGESVMSSTMVATVGSHQTSNAGGSDAFLVKFNSGGVRQWATYYGGAFDEEIISCATDLIGNVFLSGLTTGTSNAIATPGSHQPVMGGGPSGSYHDAFLVKFDPNGVRQWGTYYGGSGQDYASSCSTDAAGNVYFCGISSTSTGTSIATLGSHQAVYGSTVNCFNAFIAKFDANGVRQWGSYYGASCATARDCVTDNNGDVYLIGDANATSGTVIATPGSHQPTCASTFGQDAFIAKFNTNGVRQWATWYGGSGSEHGFSGATDALNNFYLAGNTYSTSATQTFVPTAGSHQTNYGGGNCDAFLAKFNSAGMRQYGTYYGGNGFEDITSCCVDLNGDAYLAGMTSSTISISSNNGHQITNSGGVTEGYLAKFKDCVFINPVATGNSSVCSGGNITLSVTTTGTVVPIYSWTGPNSFTSNSQNTSVVNITTLNIGVYTVTSDNNNCIETATILVKSGDPTITVSNGTICSGKSFTIVPTGAGNYSYSSGSSIVSPTTTTSYTISGTNTLGCIGYAVNTVTVNPQPTISVNSGSVCNGKSFTLVASGANSYSYSSGSAVVSPFTTTSYSVTGTSSLGCASSNTAVSTVTVVQNPTLIVSNGSICQGQSFSINPTGAVSYTYSGGQIVSPNVTSTYTIYGVGASGCVTSTLITVTVNPNPFITVNSGTVCSGNSFTIVPTGAATYTIQGGTSVVSPINTTTYSIVGTSAVGCASTNTVVSSVNVLPLPSVNVTTSKSLICEGEIVTLTANGAYTYTFYPGGAATSITVSPAIQTTYTVFGSDALGCQNTAVVTQSVEACVGVTNNNGVASGVFEMFPNPTSGLLTIELFSEGPALKESKILICNSLGQIVYSANFTSVLHEISLEHLPRGVYVVRIGNATNTKNIKLVKE